MEVSLAQRLNGGLPLTPKLLGYSHDTDGKLVIDEEKCNNCGRCYSKCCFGAPEGAVEGYKVDADDYLLKPFSFEEFQQAAERVHRQYDLLHQEEAAAASASEIDENDDIFLKTEYKVMRVAVSDIRCVEGMSEYLKIHLVSRDRPVVVLMSMKKLEERLPHASFMRVHRSWMVNLRRIREISKSRITLDNDAEVPIGDLYRETFQKYIESKFVGK